MSILVKGMEIPTNCENCRFWYQDQDSEHNVRSRCTALNHKEIITFRTMRRSDCPLIEVPPHGRLIDADVFDRHMKQTPRYFSMCCDLEEQPTIIEAEEANHVQ